MEIQRVERIPSLPARPAESHKGMFGSILVVAGSRGMAGAAALVGASALRSGAGLVRVASPAEIQPTVSQFESSYMTYPLPCTGEGTIDFPACGPMLEDLLSQATVLAVGPGLGRGGKLPMLVRWLMEGCSLPTVVDADALNALVGQSSLLDGLSRQVVLTPHPGEAGRLLGQPTSAIQADREAAALELASRPNVVVALKGHGTIVTDGNRVYVNTTGNPGMATGGTGDVLTGVIASLLGQGLEPFEAAQLGTYAHGLAGNIARERKGEIGMIATDLVASLPDAFNRLMPRDHDLDRPATGFQAHGPSSR